MGSRSQATTPPTSAATSAHSSSAWRPTRCAARYSRAPRCCATSVPAAVAWPSASMNIIDTRLTAIWWPATGVAPRRAMKKAMKVKPVTSTRIEPPIGSPSFSSAFSSAHCGRVSQRWAILNGA